MADIRSVEAGKYNKILAEALHEVEEIEKPQWVDFVKTSTANQRPNNEPDFWHKRTASILRQIYIRGIVGVQRLRTRYGGKKDRGNEPPHFRRGGGKIIRVILQQIEKAGLAEKTKGKKAGRQLTKQGKEFLEGLVK